MRLLHEWTVSPSDARFHPASTDNEREDHGLVLGVSRQTPIGLHLLGMQAEIGTRAAPNANPTVTPFLPNACMWSASGHYPYVLPHLPNVHGKSDSSLSLIEHIRALVRS